MDNRTIIQQSLDYIEDNLQTEITAAELAEMAGFSLFHYYRLFQQATGTLVMQYILRPPYLYGPMQNVYREPFVFECAEARRKFCIPGDGSMKLQFFHVEDLCRFIEILFTEHPAERIYNVGNPDAVTISEWVKLCYDAVGANLETVYVEGHPQRAYFCFHDYDYYLDVSKQMALMPDVKPLAEGLQESYAWFCQHRDAVMRKPYMEYMDANI